MPPIKAPDLEADTSRELRQYLSVMPGEEGNIDWGGWRDLTPGQALQAGLGGVAAGAGNVLSGANWLTNTLLSIAQQWNINKVVEAEAKKSKT